MWSTVFGCPHTPRRGLPFQFRFLSSTPVCSLLLQANHRKTFSFMGRLLLQTLIILLLTTPLCVSQRYMDLVVYLPDFSRAHFTLSPLSSSWVFVSKLLNSCHFSSDCPYMDLPKSITHSPSYPPFPPISYQVKKRRIRVSSKHPLLSPSMLPIQLLSFRELL